MTDEESKGRLTMILHGLLHDQAVREFGVHEKLENPLSFLINHTHHLAFLASFLQSLQALGCKEKRRSLFDYNKTLWLLCAITTPRITSMPKDCPGSASASA